MATNQISPQIFTGEFRHGLDDKNRVTIPSIWRQDEADTFFLLPHHKHDCLSVIPPEVFREIGDKSATQAPQSDHRKFIRLLFSQARHVSIDKQGRLLLPEDYCKRATLSGEVVLVGGKDRFEIWNPKSWRKSHEADFETYMSVAELVGL